MNYPRRDKGAEPAIRDAAPRRSSKRRVEAVRRSGAKQGCRPGDGRQKEFDPGPDERMCQRMEMICIPGLQGPSLGLETKSFRTDEPCWLDITLDEENRACVRACVFIDRSVQD